MHRRTVFLFTALVGLVLLVAGFAALSVPSFTLSSFAYAGSTASALKHDTQASHAYGVKGVVASASNDQDVDIGAYGDVSGGLSSTHSSRPVVSISSVTPEFGEEGKDLRVTLKLNRQLTADEKYCYGSSGGTREERRKDEVCIEGGVVFFDSYNDHLGADRYKVNDGQHAFVFRNAEVEKRLTFTVQDGECITPNRTVKVAIYTPYQDLDSDGNGTIDDDETIYGYNIDLTSFTVNVIGDDDDDFDENVPNNGLWPLKPDNYVWSITNAKFCENDGTGFTEEGDYNRAPLFTGLPREFSVQENTSAGQIIGEPVTTTDPENDTLAYSLTGTDANKFRINSSTGQILTEEVFDYETEPNEYRLAVSVNDGKDVHGSSSSAEDDSIDVTINVTDVNERPSFDAGIPTSLRVVENTVAGRDIGDPMKATDPDDNTAFNALQYSLDDGDGAAFTIDDTGQIKTKNDLDREAKSSYSVTVSVTDGKNDAGNSDTTADDTHRVTITVGDRNEAPTFGASAASALEVAENTPAGRNIGAAYTATDPDRDSLTYSLDTVDGASFTITGNGQIKTKEPLDFEAKSTYNVTVSVHDGKDEQGNAVMTADDTILVTITVTDEEEVPEFDGERTVNREVSENTLAGQPVGDPVAAEDGDNDPLTYSLTGTHADMFGIDTGTGQILTKEPLDHEARGGSVFFVRVEVYDGIDSLGGTEATPAVDDTVGVRITVTDVNEKPAFDEPDPARRTIAENTPAGQRIEGPVSATDPDRSETLTYSLDSAGADLFEIVSTTGQLKTKGALDHETQASYTVTVSVRDSRDDAGDADTADDANIQVIIDVRDLNEKPTWVGGTPENQLDIDENTGPGVAIGQTFSATDPDDGDTVKYWLVGNAASHFEIDDDGQVRTKGELDHEADVTYAFRVRAGDGRNDAGATETTTQPDLDLVVTVTVNDIGEAPKFDGPNPFTLTIPEDTGDGEEIGDSFTATDEDEGTTLSYTMGGTDVDSFTVDNDGQLTTAIDDFDFENKPTYTITITVSDGDNSTDDVVITVNIKVQDQNEVPEFDGSSTTRSVDENEAVGGFVGDAVEATDPEGNPLTYTLGGTEASSFTIEENTGQIATATELDYETEPNTYTVTVSVSDKMDDTGTSDNVVDDTLEVTITVTNVDEDGVVTLSTQYPGVGTAVTATLTDPDGATASITWSWQNSDDGITWADITSADTISYTPVRGDLNKFLQATATYTDSNVTGSTEKSFSAATDNAVRTNTAPVFADDSATRSVAENTPAERDIGAPVTATDSDTDDAANNEVLTYSLGGTDWESFTIVADSGQLQTKAALDYERKNSYSVDVIATDRPGATDTIPVTISVTDVNETRPRRSGTPLTVSFSRSTYSVNEGSSVTVRVTVSPNADRSFSVPITFGGTAESNEYSASGLSGGGVSFSSGDSQANFSIRTNSDSDTEDETINLGFGGLPSAVSTGANSASQVTIVDSSSSSRNNQRSNRGGGGGGSAYFSAPKGNNAPEFTEGSNGHRSVSENTESGVNIGNPVSATDADGDTLLYTLGGPDASSFSIDIGTGQLRTSAGLDYEEKVTYYVIMDVYDGKGAGTPLS